MAIQVGGTTVIDDSRVVTSTGLTVDTNTLHVDSTNNRVGIGTTAPEGTLHINDEGSTGPALFLENASVSEGDIAVLSTQAMQIGHYDTSTDTFTLRMEINAAGNIGINTSDPNELLSLYGASPNIELRDSGTGATNAYARVSGDSTGASLVLEADPNNAATGGTSSVIFKVDGTERGRFDNVGNLGINTTAPEATLHINDVGTTGPAIFIENASGSEGDITWDSGENFNMGTWNQSTNTFTERVKIEADGDIFVPRTYSNTTSGSANINVGSNGHYQRSTSSRRFKTNIETMEDSYADAILDLRPVWYQSLCTGDNPDWGHWGLIAEEVYEIDPRLAFLNGETGEIDGVQYDKIVAPLINLVKRQKGKIEALETEMTSVKVRLDALEA